MYLLDSCAVSDFMKGEAGTLKKIKALNPAQIYTTTITEYEVYYGLLRKFEAAHKYFKIFEDFRQAITILPFDKAAVKETALLRVKLQAQGEPIGPYDFLIAGIALSQKAILVTSNVKEFQRVGPRLVIENWRRDL